jgi:hypothetical protein
VLVAVCKENTHACKPICLVESSAVAVQVALLVFQRPEKVRVCSSLLILWLSAGPDLEVGLGSLVVGSLQIDIETDGE